MTDDTIPADKVKELIGHMGRVVTKAEDRALPGSEAEVTAHWKRRLEALLPAPRTLADELRKPIPTEANTAWFEVSELRALADRVETLEQERDELKRRIGDRGVQYSATLKMPPNQRETLESMGADLGAGQLMKELAEARVLVEEQAAEITRLEGLEVPGGWRVANHDRFGPVIAADTLDDGRHHCVFRSNVGPGISQTWVEPALLSFCDEAPTPQPESKEEFLEKVEQTLTDRYGPAPEPQPEPGYIDPASCGRYRPYLVEIAGEERVAVREDDDDFPWVNRTPEEYGFLQDDEVRVIRPLTSGEMDAR